MNYNNRLSSTLANNIRLDSSKEYEAEKIAGGNIIWLVNRPAGVKIYINSTPDRSGALVLNEANRGYKWEQLGNYGDLKLYDNFYLWTEGKNINGDLIELQVSPNADIITPILGNTADKIDKISEIENLGNNVLYGLYRVNKELFSTRKLMFFDYVNASYELPNSLISTSRYLGITKIADLRQLKFADDKIYSILIEGHCDMSGNNISIDSTGHSSRMSESLHFDLIDMDSVDTSRFTQMQQSTSNTNTTIDSNQIQNLLLLKTSTGTGVNDNFVLETRGNHFTLLGMKQTVSAWWQNQVVANSGISYALTTPDAGNFSKRYFAPSLFFQNMKDLICSWKAQLSLSNNRGNYGFHFGIKIQVEEMESLPGDPIIDVKPYINPAFKK